MSAAEQEQPDPRFAASSAIGPAANDRPHAPPDDAEAIYYYGRPMFGGKPGTVLSLTVLAVLCLIAPVIYWAVTHRWPPKVAIIAIEVIGVILLLIPGMLTQTIRYRISNYRIDFERGLIGKDINSLELWHVEDLSFHQSLIDRLLGIGTIRVISHDDTMPNLYMRGLPGARRLFDELKQRIIAVKRQQGVLKLDTGT